jgi:hypothetical protein
MQTDDDFAFVGEFEQRMLTHIALLDRMIVDADREILRLQELLEATEGVDAADRDLSSALWCGGQASIDGGARTRQPDATLFRHADSRGSQRKAA